MRNSHMTVNLGGDILYELYDLEDAQQFISLALETDQEIYTLKTVENSNWLEHGIHIVDELGLVLLPSNYPDIINLDNDNVDDSL
jgi:hypothetical protein